MPEPTIRNSIEYYGLGQSGYTAGRIEGDRLLDSFASHRHQTEIVEL